MVRILWVVIASAVGITNVRAEDWPQWLGTKRDGVWREEGILSTFPKDGPKVIWKKPIGIGYSGPAVANGKVFAMDRVVEAGAKTSTNPFDRNLKVGGTERVVALDAKTGDAIWKHEYPCAYQISYSAGPRCTPTVDGDRVYALGAMGDLHCLNATDGTVVWKKNFVADFEARVPVWGFACHPIVDGDALICVGGGTDQLVIALNKKTGEKIWASQSCEGDFGYSPPVFMELGGVRQLIVWHSRALVGLNPATGKRLWAVPFEVKAALTAPTPIQVGANRVFVTSFYNGSMLVEVGADAAKIVWKGKGKGEMPNVTEDLHSIMTTPVLDGAQIYGVCSHGQLRCIQADTGVRVWADMSATRGKLTSAKVAANPEPDTQTERWGHAFIVKQADRYFLFNEQGDLIIAKLSLKGYQELDRAHILDPTNTMARGRKVVWTHPAFANQCAIVRNDVEIVCVSLAK